MDSYYPRNTNFFYLFLLFAIMYQSGNLQTRLFEHVGFQQRQLVEMVGCGPTAICIFL